MFKQIDKDYVPVDASFLRAVEEFKKMVKDYIMTLLHLSDGI